MKLLTAVLVATLIPVMGMAKDTPPPADAMPLSSVIVALEQREGANLAYVDEVDWDDDGYWEVEYMRTDGASVEVKIDPVTGDLR